MAIIQKSKSIGLLAVVILLINGCSELPMYEKYIPVSQNKWHQDSAAVFSVEIEDTTAWYHINLHLRSNDNYPYSNIFLFREIISEKGVEYRDTAEYIMADAYGRWLGEGTGELQTFNWPFRKRAIRFGESGVYKFKFIQAMRVEELEGVENVGLTLYKKQLKGNGKKGEAERQEEEKEG